MGIEEAIGKTSRAQIAAPLVDVGRSGQFGPPQPSAFAQVATVRA